MRARRLFAAVVSAACVGLSGLANPAVASAAPAVVSPPVCQVGSPESISGATFVNNQFVNGTWSYATGVACSGSALADIALFQQLDHNGIKVDSKLKGFTGMPRQIDAIISSVPCAVCSGTWLFEWGQILKAPSGFMFSNPTAGCALIQNGLYEACVETKTVTL